MGLYLDTASSYCHTDMFFTVAESDGRQGLGFRAVNAVATLMVEVVALATYYGAYSSIADGHWYLHSTLGHPSEWAKRPSELGRLGPLHPTDPSYAAYLDPGYLGVTALMVLAAWTAAAISYAASILYLYLYYELRPNSRYLSTTVLRILYALILLLAVFATALHFHSYWSLLTSLKTAVLGADIEPCSWRDILPEVLFLVTGFGLQVPHGPPPPPRQVVCGVGSTNHFGVSKESLAEERGLLLPFIYITYLRRRPEEDEPGEDLVLDVIFNL
jgi:hypothetical protein